MHQVVSSSTGSGWDSNKQPLGGTIGAHEYYLIALASGGVNGANLPPANITGQINMAAGSGKIALVNSFTGLAGNCPIFDPSIKDLVGYGSADCGEGSTTAPAGSNSTALFRKSNGGLDTDNNANDFDAPAAPNPRRTAAIVELGPNVLSTDPRRNGTDAPRDATILVSFTEPVDSNQPGDLPDVEHGRAGARQQPGSLGVVRRLPLDAGHRGQRDLHRVRSRRAAPRETR